MTKIVVSLRSVFFIAPGIFSMKNQDSGSEYSKNHFFLFIISTGYHHFRHFAILGISLSHYFFHLRSILTQNAQN